MDEKSIEKKETPKRPFNLPGNRIKTVYRWKNGRGSELEKVGEIDQKKEIDEAARGMTCGEQIARILRGDYSGIRPGDGVTGDLTGYNDKTSGQVLHDAIKPLQKATAAAMANNLSLSELEARVNEIQNEINAKKKAQEQEQKNDQQKTQVKTEDKENA